jgi:hypothetical protein
MPIPTGFVVNLKKSSAGVPVPLSLQVASAPADVILQIEHAAGAFTVTGPNEQVPVVASVIVTVALPWLIRKLPKGTEAAP